MCSWHSSYQWNKLFQWFIATRPETVLPTLLWTLCQRGLHASSPAARRLVSVDMTDFTAEKSPRPSKLWRGRFTFPVFSAGRNSDSVKFHWNLSTTPVEEEFHGSQASAPAWDTLCSSLLPAVALQLSFRTGDNTKKKGHWGTDRTTLDCRYIMTWSSRWVTAKSTARIHRLNSSAEKCIAPGPGAASHPAPAASAPAPAWVKCESMEASMIRIDQKPPKCLKVSKESSSFNRHLPRICLVSSWNLRRAASITWTGNLWDANHRWSDVGILGKMFAVSSLEWRCNCRFCFQNFVISTKIQNARCAKVGFPPPAEDLLTDLLTFSFFSFFT